MGKLLYPVPDDESDLHTLWERDWRRRRHEFDADAFREELLADAEDDERRYLSWGRALEAVRCRGTAVLAANEVLSDAAAKAHDRNEGAGWFAFADDDRNTAALVMEHTLFSHAQPIPAHWPLPELRYDERTIDAVFGNTPPEAQLTRLAILSLRPTSRNLVLSRIRHTMSNRGASLLTDPYLRGVCATWPRVPTNIAGLVALEAARYDLMPTDPLVAAILTLHRLIGDANSSNDQLLRRALRQRLLDFGRHEPQALIAAAEWFLALKSNEHDETLTVFALEFPDLLDHVQSIAASDSPVAVRAEGFVLAIRDGDLPTLTSTVTWWADTRLYASPTPIASPTSTWLDDPALEAEIRARIDGAIDRLSTDGISEETEVTGALVQQLVNAFHPTAMLPQSTATVPFTLEVTSTNSQTNEKVTGADLGIIVDSRANNTMHLVVGHLVQIKQATNRDSSAPPQWQIKRAQLQRLLDTDPTATYWLLQQHHTPKALAVPAKVLAGIISARGDHETATVGWADIRSASIPLSQLLLDLIIGLWIGSIDDTTIRAAQGEDSRHTGVAVITARIRTGG
ncbi:hypothetical protein [Curtobacterium aurantiacum]|uniref:hypothetical protein n=1 Tax=Curtobacterium aurantiacum TaxID=3236919 RepID=UPI001BDF9FC3|nr:hypothetical protein [Curtobacterium flaccumfaciens]MBT1675907.1 hypothetical protein [Curtobacterium flaccumfaciens pv. flaccumfaciens]